MQNEKQLIEQGNIVIGIELGSTRIKAVLISTEGTILATGGADWENELIDGIWTYHQDEVWEKLQAAYSDLAKTVKKNTMQLFVQRKD